MAKAAPTAKKIAKKDSARLRPRQDWNPEDELPDLGQDEDQAWDPSQPMEVQSDDVADLLTTTLKITFSSSKSEVIDFISK